MVTAYDVEAGRLISAVKEELKKNDAIQPPEWALYAKSGASRERPPVQEDFWYIRGAALLRKIYTKGPVGVSRLKTEYGGKKNRGAKEEKHFAAGGKIIRLLLQQLEKADLVKKTHDGGRKISPKGQSLLDNTAFKLSKEVPKPKPQPKKEAPKPEKKEAPKEETAEEGDLQEKPKTEPEKKEEVKEAPGKEKKEEAPDEEKKEEVKDAPAEEKK